MSNADVLSLALAVAKVGGKALLINSDNTSDGRWVRIADAVSSGSSFAVEPKPHIIPLDLDGPEHFEVGKQIKAWAEWLGARCVLVQSGREHHKHLWIVLPPDLEPKTFAEEMIINYPFPRANVRLGTATRPPLSPHRLGCPVALVEPRSISKALEILTSRDQRQGSRLGMPVFLKRVIFRRGIACLMARQHVTSSLLLSQLGQSMVVSPEAFMSRSCLIP